MSNTPRRGRPTTFATKKAIGVALRQMREGNDMSRHLSLQLVEAGYLEVVVAAPTGGRGRPAHNYSLTKSGSSLANLAKNWMPAAE